MKLSFVLIALLTIVGHTNPAFSTAISAKQIAKFANPGRVAEFADLAKRAEELDARIWLSGGTAHTFAIHLRNDLIGPKRSFRLKDIFSWTQDLDIVVDGSDEAIKQLEQFAMQNFNQGLAGQQAWEFRQLRGSYGGKDPILTDNGDFLKRHSDSASLGFIEITDPPEGEPRVRDLLNWDSAESRFLQDVADNKITLLLSNDHERTRLFRIGHNPPLLEAVRFLLKAAQHELKIEIEDYELVKEIIAKADLEKILAVEYPRRWLIRNAPKFIYNVRDIEDARVLLDDTGLRSILKNLAHPDDKGHRYYDMAEKLAEDLNKQPLNRRPLGEGRPAGANTGSAPTAAELNLTEVMARSDDLRLYELGSRNPDHFNLYSSSVPESIGLPIKYGLVTFKELSTSHLEQVFTTKIKLNPKAQQGRDFDIGVNGEIVITNRNAIESWRYSDFTITRDRYFHLLANQSEHRRADLAYLDFKLIQRYKNKITGQNVDTNTVALIRQEAGKDSPSSYMFRDWFEMPQSLDHPEIVEAMIATKNMATYAVLTQTLFFSDVWTNNPIAHQAFKAVVDLVNDDAYASDKKTITVVKDLAKATQLAHYPNAKDGFERLAQNTKIRDLFIERFVGRANAAQYSFFSDVVDVLKSNGSAEKVDAALSKNLYFANTSVNTEVEVNVEVEFTASIIPTDPQANSSNHAPQRNGELNEDSPFARKQAMQKKAAAAASKTNLARPTNGGGGNDNSRSDSHGNVFIPPDGFKPPLDPPIEDQLANFKEAEALLAVTQKIFNDEIMAKFQRGKLPLIFARNKEAGQVMDTLVRVKGKVPVLVGESGVGKTAAMELIAQLIVFDQLPDAYQYRKSLTNAVVIQTSPASISKLAMANTPTAQAAAVEKFVASLKAVERKLKRKIIVFVDEMHQFEGPQLEALKTTFDDSDGILFVGASTNNELLMLIDRNDALNRRIKTVPVHEFSIELTRQLLTQAVVPVLEKSYRGRDGTHGRIDADAVDMAIRRSIEYVPNIRRPEAPYKLLMDAMIVAHKQAGEDAPVLTGEDVGKYLVDALTLPLDSTNLATFNADLEKLRTKLNQTVVEQERVVDSMIDLWRQIYFGVKPEDMLKVLLVAGPTGAGKTFSARQFAKHALGSEDRMLEIDCTKFSTGGHSLNTLIGAPNGIISSDKTKGILPEFLSGRGKGMNVIVLNELDKAHPDLAKHLMEMMDTGKLQGGDGRTYYVGRSLIVITTNKGDEYIFPRGQEGALSREEIEKRLDQISTEDIKQWFMEPDQNDMYNNENILPPSTLQRIDDAVPAAPVSREGAINVARNAALSKSEDLSENHGFSVEMTNAVLEYIVDAKYIPENGVRQVEREIKSLMHDAISKSDGVHRGGKIVVDVSADAPEREPVFQVDVFANASDPAQPEKTINIAAPKPRHAVDNPFLDEDLREKITGLEEQLSEQVFGQEQAVKLVSRALRNQIVDAANSRPSTIVLMGPTGIGKTELAKAIAEKRHGSNKRIGVFDLGDVKWEGDFNNIFSPPKGFVGSSTVSPFEKVLTQFPEGAVLLFDEAGNMGGGDKKLKRELLMKFYAMADEGVWRSVHGKEYQLKNFTLIWTSNEGQELYESLPNDDLRLAVWRENNSKDRARQILFEHGWPEALLGRMSEIINFKPLVADDRVKVAAKEIGRVMKRLISQHKIGEIVLADDFYQKVGNAFFSHAQGGRSVRRFAEGALTDIIGRAVVDLLQSQEHLKGTRFAFMLSDNYDGLLTYEGNFPPAREIILTLEAVTGEERVRVFTEDLANEAPDVRLVTPEELKLTAYHEASHAVANDPSRTFQVVKYVTIRGQGNYGGYARFENFAFKGTYTRSDVVARIAMLLAGTKGEDLINQGGERSSGWTRDLEMARKLAVAAVTEYGLSKDPFSLPLKDGKVRTDSEAVQSEVNALLKEGEQLAESRLKTNWVLVEALAQQLLKTGYMDKAEVDKILTYQADLKVKGESKSSSSPRCAQSFTNDLLP